MIELAHSVPGRLRVRVPSTRQERRAATAIRRAVLSIPGVREVLPNEITGSIVITYDTAELCPATLWRELNTRLAPFAATDGLPRDRTSSDPSWTDVALRTAIESLVGALVERSVLALVRAIV